MSSLDFIQQQLRQPGVDLEFVARQCGVSVRTLQMLKAGVAENTSVARVERIAAHFGFRLKPVRANARAVQPTEGSTDRAAA